MYRMIEIKYKDSSSNEESVLAIDTPERVGYEIIKLLDDGFNIISVDFL